MGTKLTKRLGSAPGMLASQSRWVTPAMCVTHLGPVSLLFIFPPAFSLWLNPDTKPCASPGAVALRSLFTTF